MWYELDRFKEVSADEFLTLTRPTSPEYRGYPVFNAIRSCLLRSLDLQQRIALFSYFNGLFALLPTTNEHYRSLVLHTQTAVSQYDTKSFTGDKERTTIVKWVHPNVSRLEQLYQHTLENMPKPIILSSSLYSRTIRGVEDTAFAYGQKGTKVAMIDVANTGFGFNILGDLDNNEAVPLETDDFWKEQLIRYSEELFDPLSHQDY